VAPFAGSIDILDQGALVALHDVPSPGPHGPGRDHGQGQDTPGGGQGRHAKSPYRHAGHRRGVALCQEFDLVSPLDQAPEKPRGRLLDAAVKRMRARDDGDPHGLA
jgi:hypothetical protein